MLGVILRSSMRAKRALASTGRAVAAIGTVGAVGIGGATLCGLPIIKTGPISPFFTTSAHPHVVCQESDSQRLQRRTKNGKLVMNVLDSFYVHSSIEDTITRYTLPVIGLTAIKIAIFAAWRVVPPAIMERHFTSQVSVIAQGGWRKAYTLFTSGMSHKTFFHFAFNTFAFVSVAPAVVHLMGDAPFLAFYFSALAFSSVAGALGVMGTSKAILKMTGNHLLSRYYMGIPSLGASGQLCALFATTALVWPESQFYILFLPFWTFDGSQLLKGLVAFDTCGLIVSMFRPTGLGHAAHLGGCLAGYLFYKFVLARYHPYVKARHDYDATKHKNKQSTRWRNNKGN